jgi:hypothetical protein
MKKSARFSNATGPLGMLLRFSDRLFALLCSLKLAVLVIASLTLALIVATVLESLYDTPTAQFHVYRAGWFIAILGLLGVNILFVALSRWPWKKHHTAFLLAHAGILMLLVGSWVTQKFGIDGFMRLQEGRSENWVEIQEPQLSLTDGTTVKTFPVQWHPPGVSFSPIQIREFGLVIDAFMPHADARIEFAKAGPGESRVHPAAKVWIQGGPMQIRQAYWLWAGDPSTARIQAGPARLELEGLTARLAALDDALQGEGMPAPGPRLKLIPGPQGLRFEATNSQGQVKRGGVLLGKPFEPGWRGGVQVTVETYEPEAVASVRYEEAKIQYGQNAPPSAIRLRTVGQPKGSELWLGLGERAGFSFNGKNLGISYGNQKIGLPFGLRLERFILEHYEGTRDPSKYASDVSVIGPGDSLFKSHISMNEPLQHAGLTFYQSSYEDAQPRPTVSILSVNQDPGRTLKYGGSLLLVAGSILLFVQRLKKAKRSH